MRDLIDFGFREAWVQDFEFSISPGNPPRPICFVAHELRTGHTIRLFEDSLQQHRTAPFPTGSDSLMVAFYAAAELSCYRALNWPFPEHVLDPFIEFRNATNGLPTPAGASLLGALVFFGLDSMSAVEKASCRALALRGGPYSAQERQTLLDYCEADVMSLRVLLSSMLPKIDVPRAIHRGRFMKAVARMEHAGVPVDTSALSVLKDNWIGIQDKLIEFVDVDYGVYDKRTFKADRMAEYVARNEIPWPQLVSGRLALDDETFKTMAVAYPQLEPLRQLRDSLSKMRLSEISVGHDGRNRCMLSAFRARTSRSEPSSNQFIYGTASWLRGLIRPTEDYGLAYVDYEQQEFGIAAALSGDPAMIDAYSSGDPYFAFARQAGAVPEDATKASHGFIRDQFKAAALAVQYGMGSASLGSRIGQPTCYAQDLLRLHRATYKRFWQWSDASVDHAVLNGSLSTVFGWTIHIDTEINARFLRNFPMQANGAEMLRLACCLATERGIKVCAPVHDAILIEAALDQLDSAVETTRKAMAEASEIVLNGFCLRSEADIVRYPGRFQNQRGAYMWSLVWDCINKMEKSLPDGTAVIPPSPATQSSLAIVI